jgi:hypothetical protein
MLLVAQTGTGYRELVRAGIEAFCGRHASAGGRKYNDYIICRLKDSVTVAMRGGSCSSA